MPIRAIRTIKAATAAAVSPQASLPTVDVAPTVAPLKKTTKNPPAHAKIHQRTTERRRAISAMQEHHCVPHPCHTGVDTNDNQWTSTTTVGEC
jgi:hypothetical protein